MCEFSHTVFICSDFLQAFSTATSGNPNTLLHMFYTWSLKNECTTSHCVVLLIELQFSLLLKVLMDLLEGTCSMSLGSSSSAMDTDEVSK